MNNPQSRRFPTVSGVVAGILVGCIASLSFAASMEISDAPLLRAMRAAPANLMMIIDDSGSMRWEVMMEGTEEGLYEVGVREYGYIFGTPEPLEVADKQVTELEKRLWKSQCAAFNHMYYNPSVHYAPWPDLKNKEILGLPGFSGFSDIPVTGASGNSWAMDPMEPANTLDMSEKYFDLVNGNIETRESVGTDSDRITVVEGDWSLHDTDDLDPDRPKYLKSGDGAAIVAFAFAAPVTGTYDFEVAWERFGGEGLSHDRYVDIQILDKDGNEITRVSRDQYFCDGGYEADSGKSGQIKDVEVPAGNVTVRIIRPDPEPSGMNYEFVTVSYVEMTYIYKASDWANSLVATVNRAHYYVWDDTDGDDAIDSGEMYLVNFLWDASSQTWSREILRGADENGFIGYGDFSTPVTDIPASLKGILSGGGGDPSRYMTEAEDIQNFANWFGYYRTRMMATKAAISHSIYLLDNIEVGLYTLNNDIKLGVMGVNTIANDTVVIDNQDAGFYEETVRDASPRNEWDNSWSSRAFNGISRVTNAKLEAEAYTGTWTGAVPSAGEYDVYAYWTREKDTGANISIIELDPSARYEFYTVAEDGTETMKGSQIKIDQNGDKILGAVVKPDQWNLLGSFSIGEGERARVRVRRGNEGHALIGESWRDYTCADAVMLKKTTATFSDNTDTLLNRLYKIRCGGSTPLRSALNDVGSYFDADLPSGVGTSPIASEDDGGACQQNFAMMVTDGFWNGDFTGIGDSDGDGSSPSLADIAHFYYERDLSPLPDHVPVTLCDVKETQHMLTYAVSFGASGTLSGWENASPCIGNLPLAEQPDWPEGDPDLWAGKPETIDDLWHATVNGRGRFFRAQDPHGLLMALRKSLADISGKLSTGGSAAVNGIDVFTTTRLYRSTYDPKDWTGNLWSVPFAHVLGKDELEQEDFETISGVRDAESVLPDPDQRVILASWEGTLLEFDTDTLPFGCRMVMHPDVGASEAGIASAASMELGKRIRHLRGDRQFGYREQKNRIGDIVHSVPHIPDGMKTLFVGSNDGMLHAFHSETLEERFAVIPQAMLDRLGNLVAPTYSHEYFVDGSPNSGNVGMGDDLKKMLVCGYGKGGKGYLALKLRDYLLDGTGASVDAILPGTDNAGSLAASLFLWEFPITTENLPDGALSDMGYSFSKPVIVKSNLSDSAGKRSVVIFGNGYGADSGDAVLWILDAQSGDYITRIHLLDDTGNGLSSPAIWDRDGNGTADFVYAGDLLGRMWKFDISSPNDAEWKVAFTDGATPHPLISLATPRPITSKPGLASLSGCPPGVNRPLVIFGTGRFLSESDVTTTDNDHIFGVVDHTDDASGNLGSWNPSDSSLWKSGQKTAFSLQKQVRIEGQLSNQTEDVAETTTNHGVDWHIPGHATTDGNQLGWVLELPYAGERVVDDVLIRGAHGVVISYVPGVSDRCDPGGDSWLNEFSICTGGRLDYTPFDTDGDRKLTAAHEDGDHVFKGDFIKFGDGIEQYLAPSRKHFDAKLFPPAIIDGTETEEKIFSDSKGGIHDLSEVAEQVGMYYWRER